MGRSVYNRNDILIIDGVWELPWYREQEGVVGKIVGGWEFSGLYVVNSGLPLTATMSGGGTIELRRADQHLQWPDQRRRGE